MAKTLETKECTCSKVGVLDFSGKKVDEICLPEELFNAEIDEYLVALAIRVDRANRRVSTAKVLDRSEVHGSNKKPYAQKHTGRARAGTTNSPIWRHGGVVHGPDGKRNYKLKMNKKDHFIALASALTDKFKNDKLIVVDEKTFTGTKTKEFVQCLKNINADEKKNLVVLYEPEENLLRASLNIPSIKVVFADNTSVYDIVNANKVILAKGVIPCCCDDDCCCECEKESN